MFRGVLVAGMGLCPRQAWISSVCAPSLPSSVVQGCRQQPTFLSVFLILIYLLCYFKAIYESENCLCKMEGSAIFFPERWHVSQ